jgi:hypothetical protein
MSDHDSDDTAVLDWLKESLDNISMQTPVDEIVATGRARRHRRRLRRAAAGVAVAAGLAVGIAAIYPHSATAPTAAPASSGTGSVHIRTAAFTVDSQSNGNLQVTWDKQQYFQDSAGLQQALQDAGFPVLIRVGEFCKGPNDRGQLDPSGVGPGVDRVMSGHENADGTVVFVFTPSAMPPGMELFIGYLSPSQLAVTHGLPGSVERLVPTGVSLVCTTNAPPPRR